MFRNLSTHTTEQALLDALRHALPHCAVPANLRIIRDRDTRESKGYAFAEFETIDQATQVVNEIQDRNNNKGRERIMIDGRNLIAAFGQTRNPALAAGGASAAGDYLLPYPSSIPQSVVPAPVIIPPWQCPRCQTQNPLGATSCSICNISKAVVDGGEEAAVAMSTSINYHQHQQSQQPNPYAMQSPGYSYPIYPPPPSTDGTTAATTSSSSSTSDPSLVECISNNRALLITGLSESTSLDSIRERFVPLSHAVLDIVRMGPLIDNGNGNGQQHQQQRQDDDESLARAFVMFEDEEERKKVQRQVETVALSESGFVIDEQRVQVELASASHLRLAVRHHLSSWLQQSNESARQRLTAAVDHAATQSIHNNRPRSRHEEWQRVVADQMSVYGSILTSATPAPLIPPRPSGLSRSFVYDTSSGYWFDSASGYYFDSSTSLYYHGHTQRYYRFDPSSAQYVEVDASGAPPTISQATAHYMAIKAAQEMEKAEASTRQACATFTAATASTTSVAPISFNLKSSNAASSLAPASGVSTVSAPSAASSSSSPSPSPFLDLPRLACLLCKRQLKSLEQLLKHEQMSQLHKDNLAKYEAEQQKKNAQTQPTNAIATASSSSSSSSTSSSVAASSQPLSAAERAALEYKKQMAQYRALEPNDGIGQRPLMK